MNLKKEIKKIENIGGEIKGQKIKEYFECIFSMKGEKGRKKVEEKLDELGLLPDYENYDDFEWYPLKEALATIIVIKEVFNWDKEKVKEFGAYLSKTSFIEKVFISYYVSTKKAFQKANHHWGRFFSEGELVPVDFNKKENKIKLHLKKFESHPVYCTMLTGYFKTALALTLSSKKSNDIIGKETKCISKGDKIHEFILKW